MTEAYKVCFIREVLAASTSDIRDDMGKNLGESASGVIYEISIFEMYYKKNVYFVSYLFEAYQVCLIGEVLPASTSDIRNDMGKNLGDSASDVIYDISKCTPRKICIFFLRV